MAEPSNNINLKMIDGPFRLAVGGDVQASNGSYLRRDVDEQLYQACLEGKFAYVLACRQIGKSSLKNAVAELLVEQGIRVARIDLNRIGQNVKQAEDWYFSLIDEIANSIGLSGDIEGWWETQSQYSTMSQRFLRFLDQVLLEQIQDRIVIFIDEIDMTLELSFTDDLFASIRSLYNDRSQNKSYLRLSFVVLGVATADELIKDPNRTPFNVGISLSIHDFDKETVALHFIDAINTAHPEKGDIYFEQIFAWTNGHPYLTQKLCQAVIESPSAESDIVAQKVTDIFLGQTYRSESNMNFIQNRVLSDQHKISIIRTYRKILQGHILTDAHRTPAINRLKLYGLVKSNSGTLCIRNKIYEHAFDLNWCKENYPINYSQILAIISSSIALLLILLSGYVIWNNTIRLPDLAEESTINFRLAQTPHEYVESLAQLIEIDNLYWLTTNGTAHTNRSIELFFTLPIEKQLYIFSEKDDKSQILVEALYLYLSDTSLLEESTAAGSSDELLDKMAKSLPDTLQDNSPNQLKIEIQNWVVARQNVRIRKYATAITYYNKAIKANSNRSNPGTRFERALVNTTLNNIVDAMKGLEEVAQILYTGEQLVLTVENRKPISESIADPTFIQNGSVVLAQMRWEQSQHGEMTYQRNSISMSPQINSNYLISPSLHSTETVHILSKVTPEYGKVRGTATSDSALNIQSLAFKRTTYEELTIALRALIMKSSELNIELFRNNNAYPTILALSFNSQISRGWIPRGAIVDKNGVILAADKYEYLIYVEPQQIEDQNDYLVIANSLESVLGISSTETYSALAGSSNSGYLVLARGINFDDGQHLLAWLKENQMSNPSLAYLNIEPVPVRYYPQNFLVSHVMGFVGHPVERRAFYGIEEFYDPFLQTDGVKLTHIDHSNLNTLPNKMLRFIEPSYTGRDMILNLDLGIQSIIEDELTQAIQRSQAMGGSIIVMEPQTGGILGLVNWPSYDPNNYPQAISKAIDFYKFMNPSISTQFEPGSIFSLIVLAAALDTNLVTYRTIFTDDGSVDGGGYEISHDRNSDIGTLAGAKVFDFSSNTDVIEIAKTLGKEHLYYYARRFGFGEVTGIDLAGEIYGLVKYPDHPIWQPPDLDKNSLGQDIAVTPIQLINAISTIANGGWLMRPQVVYARIHNRQVQMGGQTIIRRAISYEAAEALTEIMVKSIDIDTPNAKKSGYQMAGKSGIAQALTENGYVDDEMVVTFAGFGPVSAPKIAVLIKLDKPSLGRATDATEIAASAFHSVTDRIFEYLENESP